MHITSIDKTVVFDTSEYIPTDTNWRVSSDEKNDQHDSIHLLIYSSNWQCNSHFL